MLKSDQYGDHTGIISKNQLILSIDAHGHNPRFILWLSLLNIFAGYFHLQFLQTNCFLHIPCGMGIPTIKDRDRMVFENKQLT